MTKKKRDRYSNIWLNRPGLTFWNVGRSRCCCSYTARCWYCSVPSRWQTSRLLSLGAALPRGPSPSLQARTLPQALVAPRCSVHSSTDACTHATDGVTRHLQIRQQNIYFSAHTPDPSLANLSMCLVSSVFTSYPNNCIISHNHSSAPATLRLRCLTGHRVWKMGTGAQGLVGCSYHGQHPSWFWRKRTKLGEEG